MYLIIQFQAKSVGENFKALEADYERLAAAGKATRQKFEDLQCVQQIKNDLDEVSNWVNEKIALCSTRTNVKDLLALSVQQEKHKTFQVTIHLLFLILCCMILHLVKVKER